MAHMKRSTNGRVTKRNGTDAAKRPPRRPVDQPTTLMDFQRGTAVLGGVAGALPEADDLLPH